MLYAEDTNGEKILASKGVSARCPSCKNDVRAKCGSIVTHHWAHIAADCDPWSEPESEWHRGWKSLFPKECCEVVIGPHRADVKINGTVIEFQNSPISPEEIAEREAFYGDMVWVLNGSSFWDRFCFRKRTDGGFVSFRWYHPRRSWFCASRPVFIDFSRNVAACCGLAEIAHREVLGMFRVMKLGRETPCGGYGSLGTVEDFASFYNGKKFLDQSDLADQVSRECELWLNYCLPKGSRHRLHDYNWDGFGDRSGWDALGIIPRGPVNSLFSRKPGKFESAIADGLMRFIQANQIGFHNWNELEEFTVSCLPESIRFFVSSDFDLHAFVARLGDHSPIVSAIKRNSLKQRALFA